MKILFLSLLLFTMLEGYTQLIEIQNELKEAFYIKNNTDTTLFYDEMWCSADSVNATYYERVKVEVPMMNNLSLIHI